MVLDDEAVEAGAGISSRVRERPRVDRLDPAARIVRGPGSGRRWTTPISTPARAAEYDLQRVFPRSRDGRRSSVIADAPRDVRAPARLRMPAISSRDGKEARTPVRATEAEAASVAAATASLQPQPKDFGGDQDSAEHVAGSDRVDGGYPRRRYAKCLVGREESGAVGAERKNDRACALLAKRPRDASSAPPPASSIASPRLTTTRSTRRPVVVAERR